MLTFAFNSETHEYTDGDGAVIPSVTQILGAAGLCDYSRIPQHILDRAAWIGKQAHEACEFLDQDDLDQESLFPEIKPFVAAYELFKKETKFKPGLIEYAALGEIHGMKFGMTLDRAGLIGDTHWILDLKTSSAARPEWAIQIAGYKIGAEMPTAKGGVVHLKKDGTYKLLEYGDVEDHSVFAAALAVTYWKMENGYKLKL